MDNALMASYAGQHIGAQRLPAATCEVPTRNDDGNVVACGRPIHDNAFLCSTCTRRLRGSVAALPAIANDLAIVVTRQTRTGQRVGKSGSDEQPLAYDVRASDALDQLTTTVTAWCEYVAAERGVAGPADRALLPAQRRGGTDDDPAYSAPGLDRVGTSCAWLLRQTDWLRRHESALDALDAMRTLGVHSRRIADLPPDLQYVGQCDGTAADSATGGCGRAVYARDGAKTAMCAACGAVYPTEKRRAYLLARLDDEVANAATLARALTGLGQAVTANAIRQWKSRGRLTQATDTDGRPRSDTSGRPLYRIGDVRHLVTEDGPGQPPTSETRTVSGEV